MTFRPSITGFLFVLLVLTFPAKAALRINEFVADNDGGLLDSDGDDSDWIELHNPGSSEVSTAGLFLTDNASNPTKWPLPSHSIPGGGYLVIFASGKDRRDPSQELHTNFSLASGGEYLAMIDTDGVTPLSEFAPEYPNQFYGVAYGLGTNSATESQTFIPWPTRARWHVPLEESGDLWRQLEFDDTTWTNAQTGIGFGYSFPDFIGEGGNTKDAMLPGKPSVYLRIPFEVESPAEVAAMTLNLHYEDGFAAYLNGELVASANLPDPLTFNSTATASREVREGDEMDRFELDFAGKLRPGTNLLAFQLLNNSSFSSDILLVPELRGETRDLSGGIFAGYLEEPTPGAPNAGVQFTDYVRDTTFDIDRGFFDAPFDLTINCATPGATLVYTTDGSIPTLTNGTRVPAPDETTPPAATVPINTTTTVRAAAFRTGMRPTNVDTQTYLFLQDVIRQPARPSGAPTSWGSRAADYEMDPDVVDHPVYRNEIIEGLRSIRTLSIVVPNDEFFNNPRGIYANPRAEGRASEREVSFEFLHPDNPEEDTQINCGIRIHGNGSRSPSGQPKHGFRVEFRGIYGDRSLNYRLFPETNVDRFDSLILRCQNAHGWTRSSQISNSVGTTEREQSQYIRDCFARDIMKGMGQTSGEATFVHLYINGLYWGLYNPVEYPRAAYGASHFGGPEKDYDAINRRTTTTKILDGTFDAWNEMQALANSGLTTREKYEEMETHMNIDNLIDYMLMHQYMGSRDGPEVFNSNNMRAVRKSRGENPTTWIGMPWDMEASMFEINVTRNVNVDDPNTLVRVYTRLRQNPEFRLRYADHVQRHCFNNGALTPTRTAAVWEARAEEIFTAIIGESARWGDYRRPSHPFTRDDEWQQERNRLLNTYFPTRTEFLVNLLRNNNLYPETDAPSYRQTGSNVTMEAPSGIIYYSLDGSDPRELWTGNAIGTRYTGPISLNQSTTILARTLDGGEWSALNEQTFLVGTPANADNTVISELMYHPADGETEFIELANTSDGPVDFSGVTFAEGIDYTVPTGTTIPPGGFLVIRDFQNDTALANGGETITLLAADQSAIESFRYNDKTPWPESPDGLGPSLTRILPAADPALPASWRPSVSEGGSPGSSDAVAFEGDPTADLDGDGLNALLEHAFGTSDSVVNTDIATLFNFSIPPARLQLQRNLAADDIVWVLEESDDLENWTPVTQFARSLKDNFDGTATITYSNLELTSRARFWRSRAVLRK